MKFASYAYAFVLSLAGTAAMAQYANMQKMYIHPDNRAATVDDLLEFGEQTLATGACYTRDNAIVIAGLVARYTDSGLRFEVVDQSNLTYPALQDKTYTDLQSKFDPLLSGEDLPAAKTQDGSLEMRRADGRSMISLKMMGEYFVAAVGAPAKLATSADRYCYFHKNLREARQMKALSRSRFFEVTQNIFDSIGVPADLDKVTLRPGVNVTYGVCASAAGKFSKPAVGALLTRKDSNDGIIAADFGFYTPNGESYDQYVKDLGFGDVIYTNDRLMVALSRMFGDFFATASSIHKHDAFVSSSSAEHNIMFRYRQYGPYIISSMIPLKDSADLNPDNATVCAFFPERPSSAIDRGNAISFDPQKNWVEHDPILFNATYADGLLTTGDVIRIKAKPLEPKEPQPGQTFFKLKSPIVQSDFFEVDENQEGTFPWSAEDNRAGFKIVKMTNNFYKWDDDLETPGSCFSDHTPRKSGTPVKLDVANDNARLSFRAHTISLWNKSECVMRDRPTFRQFLEVFDVEFALGERLSASPAFSGW